MCGIISFHPLSWGEGPRRSRSYKRLPQSTRWQLSSKEDGLRCCQNCQPVSDLWLGYTNYFTFIHALYSLALVTCPVLCGIDCSSFPGISCTVWNGWCGAQNYGRSKVHCEMLILDPSCYHSDFFCPESFLTCQSGHLV